MENKALEQAAFEATERHVTPIGKTIALTEFLAGANWQAAQDGWVSVSDVIDLLTKERERSIKICNSVREKYEQSYENKVKIEALYEKLRNYSIAFVDRERAEIARNLANFISTRTGLDTDFDLRKAIEREYFPKPPQS